MIQKHSGFRWQQIPNVIGFLAMTSLWPVYCMAQTATSIGGQGAVSVKSWKRGDTKLTEKEVTLDLDRDIPEYEIDVYSSQGPAKFFRFHVRQDTLNTLRDRSVPCWVADLRQVTKRPSGVNLLGPSLLSVEGPGVGDDFPREEWAPFFCPIEKPNRVLDGSIYPMRAERRFLIEGFVLSLQVTDYQLDKERKKLNHVDLRIVFSNLQSR